MSERQYYELRVYRTLSSRHAGELGAFLEQAEIPAYNRLGIEPVGVFTGVYGPDNASLYVLIPHPDMPSVAEARDQLLADQAYRQRGKGILERGIENPAYYRIETTVLRAFQRMPTLELPQGNLSRRSRVFEVRIYEGHSLLANKKKIEMFNEGGEIEIFRNTGLCPVLFGETIAGARMPNLTYMVTFDSIEERDPTWQRFIHDPAWAALREDPQYANTVSTITDLILRPTSYSQM
jgi:hypothetical protein